MTIYTPTELIETMQKRIASGMYQPDQKMVVTIWVGDDAHTGPNSGRRVLKETWTKLWTASTVANSKVSLRTPRPNCYMNGWTNGSRSRLEVTRHRGMIAFRRSRVGDDKWYALSTIE